MEEILLLVVPPPPNNAAERRVVAKDNGGINSLSQDVSPECEPREKETSMGRVWETLSKQKTLL